MALQHSDYTRLLKSSEVATTVLTDAELQASASDDHDDFLGIRAPTTLLNQTELQGSKKQEHAPLPPLLLRGWRSQMACYVEPSAAGDHHERHVGHLTQLLPPEQWTCPCAEQRIADRHEPFLV